MSQYRKKISMQDIANHLSISKNAVSLALNNKAGVSEELRKMIFKTAQDIGYSGLMKLKKAKSSNILVLIPEYIRHDTYFYNNIYWSVENEAQNLGYNAIMTSVNSNMEEKLLLPALYYEMDFSGIIAIGIFQSEYIAKLFDTRLPIISVDNYYDEIPLDAVVTANEEGAYKVVKFLIENGHRDIGYIGSIQMTSSLYERWCGYNKVMLQYGLKVSTEHCILSPSPLDMLLGDADELERHLCSLESYPTAWFCGNDRIAIALINILSKKNIKVPENISVAGFDDIEASNIVSPALTTLKVNRQQMGVLAVACLIKRIENGGERVKTALYGELVIRDSVRNIMEDIN